MGATHVRIVSAATRAAAPLPRGDVWEGVIELESEGEARLDEVLRFFTRETHEDADRLSAYAYEFPSLTVGDHVALAPAGGRWEGEWIREPGGWRRSDSGS